ncbi:hypothetical protein VTK56DRAFT_515 [Thermocarpiscus australiensis]
MSVFTNQERSILGPLTTTFTPPAPCSIAVGLCPTCNLAWRGQTCAPSTVQDDPGCWPATTEGAPKPKQMLFGWGFYSPGLHCPAGYTSACTAIAGETTGWRVQYQMEAGETFVGCCPSGFGCANLNGQTCFVQAKSTTFPTVTCDAGSSNGFGFMTLPNSKVRSVNLYAPMIQLAWKASDLGSSSASTTSTSTTGTSTSSSIASNTHQPQSSPESSPLPTVTPTPVSQSSNTLSTGAIAGIAIGAAALLLAIVAAAFYIWRRRRTEQAGRQTEQAGRPPDYSPGPHGGAGWGANPQAMQFQHYYSGTSPQQSPVSELSGMMPPFEAPGPGDGPAEMPGHGQGFAVEMATEKYR